MSSIRIKEFEVPTGIIAEVADIINSNDLETELPGLMKMKLLFLLK